MRQRGYKNYKWTPELAYAVGLIVTDGNLSKDRRHISLRSKDIAQMRTFRSCLGIDNKIETLYTEGRKSHRVQYGSVDFYHRLECIGLFAAKTYTIGSIMVPDELLRDFVRGHLDGDGNIRVYWDEYNSYRGRSYRALRVYARFISASKAHIMWLRESITRTTGLKGAIIINKPKSEKHVPIWEIRFAKKEALDLFDWMYYDTSVPCLPRKRVLVEKAKKLQGNVRRRKYAFLKDE